MFFPSCAATATSVGPPPTTNTASPFPDNALPGGGSLFDSDGHDSRVSLRRFLSRRVTSWMVARGGPAERWRERLCSRSCRCRGRGPLGGEEGRVVRAH